MFKSILKVSSSTGLKNIVRNMSQIPDYSTLKVTVPKAFVYHVELNRPKQANSINTKMQLEIKSCFDNLGNDPECRAIVISGSGNLFCGGIDLNDFAKMGPALAEHDDVARKAKIIKNKMKMFQDSLSSIETCNKPVIAAVDRACIGAGVDLITAADIRYSSEDAYFQIKEILLGMAADVGTLQRLPKIIGNQSLVRELAFTGRIVKANEALNCGLVSRVFPNKGSLLTESLNLAEMIAKNSPVAVQCTKESLIYARDHSVADSLDEICIRNQFLLQSEDFLNSVMHVAMKQEGDVVYSKL